MSSCSCGREIESERKSLGLVKCKICAFKMPTEKVRGYMEWSHKTAPTIRLVSKEGFDQFKRDTDRKGQSSILRSKMVSGGRLV